MPTRGSFYRAQLMGISERVSITGAKLGCADPEDDKVRAPVPTLCSEDSANGMHAPSNKTRRWLFYVMKIFIRLLHMLVPSRISCHPARPFFCASSALRASGAAD